MESKDEGFLQENNDPNNPLKNELNYLVSSPTEGKTPKTIILCNE